MKRSVIGFVFVLLVSFVFIGCGDVTIVGIEATNPYKTSYIEGETFDKTGMVVKAIYDDASDKIITDYNVDKTTLSINDSVVTISYEGFTTTINITVSSAKETYTVSFNNSGHGDACASVSNTDKIPTNLPNIEENGFIFEGWYLDNKFETKAVEGSTIENNVTLYAKWREIVYDTLTNLEANREYTVKGTIVLVTNVGYIIENETGMVFVNSDILNYSIGDVIEVTGTTLVNRGFIQFKNDSIIKKLSTTTVSSKNAALYDGAKVNEWIEDNTFGVYIEVRGVYSKSTNYYKLGIEGCGYSFGFYEPTEDLVEILSSLSAGYSFTVKGYLLGNTSTTGNDFIYFGLESISDITKPIEQEGNELYHTGFETEEGFSSPIDGGSSYSYNSKTEREVGTDHKFGIFNGDIKKNDNSNCVVFRNYKKGSTTLLYNDDRYLVTKFTIKDASRVTVTAKYSGNFGDVNITLSYSVNGTDWTDINTETISTTSSIYSFDVNQEGEYYYRLSIICVESSSSKSNQDIYIDDIGFYK